MKTRTDKTSKSLKAVRVLLGFALVPGLGWSAFVYSQDQPAPLSSERVVARVNGASITEANVLGEIEALYPSNAAHGGIRPEKLKELRSKALEELIVQELAYQQAIKTHAVIPTAEVRAEYRRLRSKYGAQAFDQSLQASGLTRPQTLKKLQRRMTLERLTQQEVVLPSRATATALRAYYQQNLKKYQRPERVHIRLILAAVDPASGGTKPEDERKAREKIEKVYEELKAGKDFADLAQQYSDDFYRVKGGDVGWMHRGSMEPEFEKVALSIPVGQFGEIFRTPYGYNLLKVEGREPARLMKFEEVRARLKAELEQKKLTELRQAWISQLKKGARIEVVEPETAVATHAAH